VYLHGLSWITVAFGIMIAYILAPTTLLVRAPYLQYSVDLAFVIMGIGLIFLLAGYLRRRTSIFTVGDGQISIKVGVFSTRDIVILARQVGDVSVSRSLLGRMLGYGTVVVTGVGGSVEVFAEIEDPYQFQEAIRAIAG
jgi:uncharacterized membrane protein YdbT with pleckstrin-like domain